MLSKWRVTRVSHAQRLTMNKTRKTSTDKSKRHQTPRHLLARSLLEDAIKFHARSLSIRQLSDSKTPFFVLLEMQINGQGMGTCSLVSILSCLSNSHTVITFIIIKINISKNAARLLPVRLQEETFLVPVFKPRKIRIELWRESHREQGSPSQLPVSQTELNQLPKLKYL